MHGMLLSSGGLPANVNSELKIKMKEFRYTDASDNMIREYDMRPVKEILSGVNKK